MMTETIEPKTAERNGEGFLLNPEDWSEELARTIAAEEGIAQLTDEHWKVVNFMRSDWQEKKQVPTIRRMKNAGGVPIKDLYRLFPQGPAKKAAKISGLEKPKGCI